MCRHGHNNHACCMDGLYSCRYDHMCMINRWCHRTFSQRRMILSVLSSSAVEHMGRCTWFVIRKDDNVSPWRRSPSLTLCGRRTWYAWNIVLDRLHIVITYTFEVFCFCILYVPPSPWPRYWLACVRYNQCLVNLSDYRSWTWLPCRDAKHRENRSQSYITFNCPVL